MADREFRMKVMGDSTVEVIPADGPGFPVTLDQDKLRELTIRVLNTYASKGEVSREVETEVLGSLLYESLFQGAADSNFKFQHYRAKEEGRKLRVVLEFPRQPEGPLAHLLDLPWEFLHVPRGKWEDRGFFIASEANLILTRQLSAKKPPPGTNGTVASVSALRKKVRVLLVMAKPNKEGYVDKENDVLTYITEWKGDKPLSPNSPTVSVEELANPDKACLEKTIKDEGPWDIVHFLGHGRYTHNSDDLVSGGEIALVDKQGEAAWVNDRTFADCFRSGSPELVFLQACQGAETHSSTFLGFRGVAMRLVSDGVPAVIAMQYSISNVKANAFASAFYKELRKGRLVSEAVQAGRETLGKSDRNNFEGREFGSPVLYLQNADMCFANRRPDAPSPVACPACRNDLMTDDRYCKKCQQRLNLCETCARRLVVDPGLVCESCPRNEAAKALSPEAVPAQPAPARGHLDSGVRLATSSASPLNERGTEPAQGPVGARIGRT